MANISAALVKELRERTAAGMMDCKKALEEAAGDIELAIENMRKSGQAKAAKKAGRIAAEGVIFARTEGNIAAMIELNSETDFVAKDASFMAMGQKIADIAATQAGDTLRPMIRAPSSSCRRTTLGSMVFANTSIGTSPCSLRSWLGSL